MNEIENLHKNNLLNKDKLKNSNSIEKNNIFENIEKLREKGYNIMNEFAVEY